MNPQTITDREKPAPKRVCPSWCEDQDQPNHWEHTEELWQSSHARRFGPFVVYLPHELHDNGENWAGQCEVHTDETDVVVYYAVEAVELANHLQAAAQFATDMDARVAQGAR